MSDLKANLDTLNEAVPALAAKLETVVQEAEAYEKAVEEALENFGERRKQGDELLSRVKEVLEKLEQQATDQQIRLDKGREALDTAVDGAEESIKEESESLGQAVKACGDSLNSLEEALTDGGARAKNASEDGRDALQSLAALLDESEGGLEAATQAVRSELEEVDKTIADSQKEVQDAVADLGRRMGDLADEVKARLSHTQDRLREMREGQEPAIGDSVSQLVDQKDELFRNLQDSVESEIRQALDAHVDEALQALARLADSFNQTADTVKSHREAAEPLFEALAERLAPLKEGVDAVKGGAKIVGLDWQ